MGMGREGIAGGVAAVKLWLSKSCVCQSLWRESTLWRTSQWGWKQCGRRILSGVSEKLKLGRWSKQEVKLRFSDVFSAAGFGAPLGETLLCLAAKPWVGGIRDWGGIQQRRLL